MKEPESDSAKFDLDRPLLAGAVHRFAHSAMATVFEIYCTHPDAGYAGQAAQAAFGLVDRLELELSRFIENSDISRINSLESGQWTRVSPSTLECLQIARRMYAETGKAFDVSIGSGFEHLEFDPEGVAVGAAADGIRLDLGGIGKGYAVDRMAALLEEWSATRALLHGGFSSVLALDPPPGREGWPISLSNPARGYEVLARVSAVHRAFSASGVRKGDHIVDPRNGRPVRDRLAAWVALPRGTARPGEATANPESTAAVGHSAAVAEAFSTAFMILPDAEIAACCDRWVGLEAWLIAKNQGNGEEAGAIVHLPVL